MSFFANIFGYLLNFLYELVKNYGLAIILFSIIVKAIMIPISIKQQKTMKKTTELQGKLKEIQFKYKNDPEGLNRETMELYRKEKINPFGGCLSGIIQIVLLLSIFYLVRSPLTYMKKVDVDTINSYREQIQTSEENKKSIYEEIEIIRRFGNQDEKININMNFLGIDLSQIPTENLSDYRTFIIPVLYVISSFVSIKLTSKMQGIKKDEENNDEENPMLQTSKSMTYMMPIMSISIAMVAPLGLALYWLINNILMVAERLILNKVISKGETNG